MNRRQSLRFFVGTLFAGAFSAKAGLSEPAKPHISPDKPANPKLVPELTKMLEQAKNGELTSFSGVFFTRDGSAAHQGEFSRLADLERVSAELEKVKQENLALLAEVKADAKKHPSPQP